MPVTAIDEKTALILIDLQNGIVNATAHNGAAEVVKRAITLVDAFHEARLPVFYTRVAFANDRGDMLRNRMEAAPMAIPDDPEWSSLVPALPVRHEDILLTKHNWNAFYGTALDLQLRRRGITGIVIAGISTSIGVEGTARAAMERAYNVTFVKDAMTDGNLEAHANSLKVIFPRIGEIGNVEDVLAKLS